MKSQSTLFQGAKRLNNVLLGIETFLWPSSPSHWWRQFLLR